MIKDKMAEDKKLFSIVKKEIDLWNPYGLLPDAPSNEFDGETEMIVSKIKQNDSVYQIAKIISEVFAFQFEPEYFTVENCLDVAKEIKKNL